jgi:hypothetical protein
MTQRLEIGSRLTILATRLNETLAQEEAALSLIGDVVQMMLTALRNAEATVLASGAALLQERIRSAAQLREAQNRQSALFFRAAGLEGDTLGQVILELSRYPEASDIEQSLANRLSAYRKLAEETSRLVVAFDYALRYADQINHELVYLLHGLIKPETGRVYTARGRTEGQKNRRSMLNRVG